MNSVDFLLLTLVFFQNKADTSFTVSQMIWAFFEISRDLCGALSFVPERFFYFFAHAVIGRDWVGHCGLLARLP